MRLNRPLYEGLPLIYMAIGGLGISLAYFDPDGPRTAIAFAIGCVAEIAAVTVFLRRHDYRALSQEYSRNVIDAPNSRER